MINKIKKATDFQKYLKKQLEDKKIKKHYDEYDKQLKLKINILNS